MGERQGPRCEGGWHDTGRHFSSVFFFHCFIYFEFQHISLKLKDNNKGIGFDGHDDTWLAHQNDFQSVLAALNIEHGEAGKDLSETEKKANLEELSKKSRRRVHYQKFVR